MFGYFRFNQLYASPKIKNVYKNYYCGTCFALEYNYGEFARCILSYDVVILALVAKLYDEPNRKLLPCFCKRRQKKQFWESEEWKKIAAINVLLMNAKFDDDINDDKSKKAKAAAIVFHNQIKKAEMDFPELAEIVKEGYLDMYRLETAGARILEICNSFANMMEKLVVTAFSVDSARCNFVKGISRWLYFIDQLDDYDADIKEKKYNPLLMEGISKAQLINIEHECLFEIMREIFKNYRHIKTSLDLNCPEDCLLYAVINEAIPSMTSLVLSDRKKPQILHRKRELEWEM